MHEQTPGRQAQGKGRHPAKPAASPANPAAPRKPKAAPPPEPVAVAPAEPIAAAPADVVVATAAPAIRVLAAVSEIYPLVKTGGLADVAGALPGALAKLGVEVRTLVPGYPAVMQALTAAEPVLTRDDLFGGPARVLAASVAGLDLLVLDAPHLYARPGGPYVDQYGQDWWDNPAALRRPVPHRRRYRPGRAAGLGAGRGALPRLAGRPGCRLLALCRRPPPADGDDDPQPGLHRPGADQPARDARAAAGIAEHGRRRVLRRDRLHEGRAAVCRRDHPPSRRPMRRKSRPPASAAVSTACCARGGMCCTAS